MRSLSFGSARRLAAALTVTLMGAMCPLAVGATELSVGEQHQRQQVRATLAAHRQGAQRLRGRPMPGYRPGGRPGYGHGIVSAAGGIVSTHSVASAGGERVPGSVYDETDGRLRNARVLDLMEVF